MAYEKKTWVCGETITADGLNNIENGIEEALDCCESKLPEVTADDDGDILTVVDGEWEKAEPGFKCVEAVITLTEESVTTALDQYGSYSGQFSYSSFLEADTLTVTFNGTEYEVDRIDLPSGWHAYGGFTSSGPDFSVYPFTIVSSGSDNTLYTEATGTYSVKIEAVGETIETSECFVKAVKLFGLKYVKDAEVEGGVVANAVGDNAAMGLYSFASGRYSKAFGECSHAENDSQASGKYSHSENTSYAFGDESHAEGVSSYARGLASHTEGQNTTASGTCSHAEGEASTASGNGSHAEGGSIASGIKSHAEGSSTASGSYSHAEGNGTIANHRSQHVFGEYNVADPSTATAIDRGDYVEIVGNGANNFSLSNARTLDWQGNETLAGSLTLGKGTADETTITAAQLAQLLTLLP